MPIARLLRVKHVGNSHLGPIKATKSLGRIVEAIFIIKKNFEKNIYVLHCKNRQNHFFCLARIIKGLLNQFSMPKFGNCHH